VSARAGSRAVLRWLRQLGLLLLALWIGGLLISPWQDLVAARGLRRDVGRFAVTPCTQVAPSFDEHTSKRGHAYFTPELMCEFSVAGRRYHTDSHLDDNGFASYDTREDAVGEALRIANNGGHNAYYDPLDPSRATMSRAVSYHPEWWGIVAIGILTITGAIAFVLFVVVRGVRRFYKQRREREDFPTATLR
jgi:hypothetical protein